MFRPVPLLAFVLLAALPIRAQQPVPLTPRQQLAREVYRELIEINTVDSVGLGHARGRGDGAALPRGGLSRERRAGARPARQADEGQPRRALPRPARASTRKPILLLAHLDVVAALRSDWTLDPFVLHREGRLLLRPRHRRRQGDGVDLRREPAPGSERNGWVPDRDVILALTADEEGGDANGVDFLLDQHRDLIDAAFAINEGGGGSLRDGKPFLNSVQAAEKIYADFTLTARNRGGHSSVPRPDNAIYELVDALARVARYRVPRAAERGVAHLLRAHRGARDRPRWPPRCAPSSANPGDSAAAAVLARDPRYNSMLRTTCVATRLSGGHAYNALPQTATANVNCRIVPTSNPRETREALVRVVADTGIHITETIRARRSRRRRCPVRSRPR